MLRVIDKADVKGKRILVRVDYNVPLNKGGSISNDERIRESLETIRYLVKKKGRVILISHLGRPDGRVVEELRLDRVAERLSRLIHMPARKIDTSIGREAEEAAASLKPGSIMMLENIRFYPGEEENDKAFSSGLARLGDIYVNDAFSVSHRSHASTLGVARLLPGYAGLQLAREVGFLSRAVENPKRPLMVIMGGSKISDKIKAIEHMMGIADYVLLGGALANTVLKAAGKGVGKSLVEESAIDCAKGILEKASRGSCARLVLPLDLSAATRAEADAEVKTINLETSSIPKGMMSLDIGPETVKLFSSIIKKAKTVIWNGPVGMFEIDPFARGSIAIAKAIASLKVKALTIAGGGETIAALAKAGKKAEKGFTHISTGGGAMLTFLEGAEMPPISILSLTGKGEHDVDNHQRQE
ncbi:TPA: phosphoglycerate kinase [Candidatus Woesearchaeota archaeon]|nr:phosphoglycerate kinase [Candidatus Woesearchaeota archaeon]